MPHQNNTWNRLRRNKFVMCLMKCHEQLMHAKLCKSYLSDVSTYLHPQSLINSPFSLSSFCFLDGEERERLLCVAAVCSKGCFSFLSFPFLARTHLSKEEVKFYVNQTDLHAWNPTYTQPPIISPYSLLWRKIAWVEEGSWTDLLHSMCKM